MTDDRVGDTPSVEHASYRSIQAAIERARRGVATQLESTIGMSVDQAYGYARGLLVDGRGGVRLRIDGFWLYIEPDRLSVLRTVAEGRQSTPCAFPATAPREVGCDQ